jgi:hypothetical protein
MHHSHFSIKVVMPSSWMNPNFKTLNYGEVLAGEQESNEKNIMSTTIHPCGTMVFFLIFGSMNKQLAPQGRFSIY